MQESERRRPSRHEEVPDPFSGEEYSNSGEDVVLDLPTHRLRLTLAAGAIAGIVMTGFHVLIPLLNSAAFRKAAVLGVKMSYDTAVSVAGSDCLNLLLDIVICSALGYVVGRYAVQRRLGFFAGLLAGAVLYIGVSVISYIPNYPGNVSMPAFSPTFILPIIIIGLFYAIIAGLVSLLATWIKTRKHPYYTGEIS